MIPKELFKKIRQIEITTTRMVSDIFAGQYHSVFKGQGMEFDEVREYQFGDDTRRIDWNVTARTGKPHIKKFVEERELSVMILVDASKSCQFGSKQQLKSSLAAEIAAVFAFSAIKNNDKVGLIIFTDRIEKFIPPRKGSSHVLRVIREILYFKPEGVQTNISLALDYLNKITLHRTVAFLISDFLDIGKTQSKEDVQKALLITNRKHDLIAVTLNDPREEELVNCGLVEIEDAETGKRRLIDTSSPWVRRDFKDSSVEYKNWRKTLFQSTGIDHIDIDTHLPYESALIRFFKERKSRRR